jgi:tetratricopeptide (TPR) repeat protein
LRAGRLEESQALLLEAARAGNEPYLLVELVAAFSARGDHLTTIETARLTLQEFPYLGQDKTFRQAVDKSEKALRSPSSLLPRRRLATGKWVAAAAFVLLVFGGVGAFDHYKKNNHPLWIVNAYPGEIRVVVDGEHEVRLSGQGVEQLTLAEGKHVAVVGAPLSEEIEVALERTFLERLSSAPVWVLDPGGLAVLAWQETMYAADDAKLRDYEPRLKLHAGRSLWRFEDIDDPFRDFPETVELSSQTSVKHRTRIAEMAGDARSLYPALLAFGDPVDCVAYLENWLRLVEDDGELALGYSGAALLAREHGRAEEFLRQFLRDDPLNVEVHRAYQEVVESRAGGSEALRREYDARLAGRPGDPQLLYLRARIEPDPGQAVALLERAIAIDPASYRVLGGLAFIANARADYAAASSLLERALAVAGDAAPELDDLFLDALFAARQFDRLEGLLRASLDESEGSVDWSLARRLVLLFVKQERLDDAKEALRELTALDARLSGTKESDLDDWLQAEILYAQGDHKGLAKHLRKAALVPLTQAQWELALALDSGDVTKAKAALTRRRAPAEQGADQLLMSLLYRRKGLTGMAEDAERRALSHFGASPPFQTFAEMLAGSLPVDRAAVERLLVEPGLRALLITVLAERFPDQAWLRHEAARSNAGMGFPARYLDSLAVPAPEAVEGPLAEEV